MHHKQLRDYLARLRHSPWKPSTSVVGGRHIEVPVLLNTIDVQVLATLFEVQNPVDSEFEETLFLLRDLHVGSAVLTTEVIKNAMR